MAENLLFRKGTAVNLATATKIPGAISFTTDEPAIYLDVQEGDEIIRKRIGDLIIYETLEELIADNDTAVSGAVNSWSKTSLYYIVKNNALLKWTGDKWQQINSISDIEEKIDKIEKIINGEEGLINQISNLNNTIETINHSTSNNLIQIRDDIINEVKNYINDESNQAQKKEYLADLITSINEDYNAKNIELNTIIDNVKNAFEVNKTIQEVENIKIREEFVQASEDLENKIKAYIDTNMIAADAMKYKGVIANGILPINNEGIKSGWVYKVSDNFATSNVIDTDEAVIVTGDLLIASHDLEKGATIPIDFWHHISSGHENNKNSILTSSKKNANGDNTSGIEFILQSHLKKDRGSVTIVGSAKSNVRVIGVIEEDDIQNDITNTTIALGLEWGSFD